MDADSRPDGTSIVRGVVVVEPLHTVRAALTDLIRRRTRLAVVGEAGAAEDAMRIVASSVARGHPPMVLVALGLPGEHDAAWLIRSMRGTWPRLTILAVGANAEPPVVSRMVFAGADGFLDKRADPAEFLGALQRAATGEIVFGGLLPAALSMLADELQRPRRPRPLLSERERQVLALVAGGLTARQVSTRLGVAERTITTHLGRIYRKLGADGRMAAVSSARSAGLIDATS